MCAKLNLYFNTVKYLRPKQIAGQLVKPLIMKSIPSKLQFDGQMNAFLKTMIPALDLDADYLARFDTKKLLCDEFTLLNETHKIDLNTWKSNASPLWRFNLHYFEYAIALAAQYQRTNDQKYYDKCKELVHSWIMANPIGIGDGWHPYTISMRLPNWFICFELLGNKFEQDVTFHEEVSQSVYAQYRTLLKRKEIWQLGNHYFENLKAIVFSSLLFYDNKTFDKYFRLFLREVNEEVLFDGVHFELSIMYHKVILEDILRMAYWLKQTEKEEINELLPVLQKMVNAVASLEKGMGKTPLFNDAGDGIAKEGAALVRAANELFSIKPVLTDDFTASGYYKLYDGNIALMIDAGAIGPQYMAGHGHCDCLSFELSVAQKPLFINAGTYQYQSELRQYFRSTKAHNTLAIDNKEQSECWGEHRVARRISDISAQKHEDMIIGSYISYLGDMYTRTIKLSENCLSVLDATQTRDEGMVHSYLHLAPGYAIRKTGDVIQVFSDTLVCYIYPVDCNVIIHTEGELALCALSFGKLSHTAAVEFCWAADVQQHGYLIKFLN